MSSTTSLHDKEKLALDANCSVLAANPQGPEVDEIDPIMNRRVRNKIDRTVLVIFTLIYMFQYLDKIALSCLNKDAAIFGMKKDLHLVGQDYSWSASSFYFGQLGFEYIAIYLLHRLPIKKFVGVSILCWGVVMMSMAAASNFAGMVVVRVILGMAEGAVAPAFVILVSIWYTKAEQPLRIATFVSANAMAQIVGGLLLYGCGSIKGAAIAGFRISYLIAGGVTILLGAIFMVVVPLSPSTAWFLNPEERIVATKRVAREHASAEHSNFSWPQAIATLKDPSFYLIFLWAFFVCITSVVTFGSIVISGLGFDSFRTILVGLPGPAIQLATIWIGVAAIAIFPNQRGLVQTALISVPLAGVIVLKTLPYEHKWALTGAYWLATCNSSVFVINMSLISSNFKGHTRKTMCSVVYFIGYCVGCICGPQLFISTESPLYPTAMKTIIAMYVCYIVAQLAYRQLCSRENNRRDRLAAEGVAEAVARPAGAEDNSTDLEDLGFRYVL
ncbi:MFS transporter, ACS family, allantoate permease, partial [Phenoliferia sp. Uapishka_3]